MLYVYALFYLSDCKKIIIINNLLYAIQLCTGASSLHPSIGHL